MGLLGVGLGPSDQLFVTVGSNDEPTWTFDSLCQGTLLPIELPKEYTTPRPLVIVWAKVGESLEAMRIYFTGPLRVDTGVTTVDEHPFPGKQGLLVFAYLVLERSHPVARSDIADALWGDTPPGSVDKSVSAIVSKLRGLLRTTEMEARGAGLETHLGRYQLRLPAGIWVDVEAARHALDEAEGALRSQSIRQAWGPANIVVTIALRPFLPGVESPWVGLQRVRLRQCLVRGLVCLSQVSLLNGEHGLGVQHATEIILAEPFREVGYQQLMRAHVAAGDRAEALRVYEQCRTQLSEELGADPSPQTEELYLGILRVPSAGS